MDQFRFCETYFTTYQRFVADQSGISPFLGGLGDVGSQIGRLYVVICWETFGLRSDVCPLGSVREKDVVLGDVRSQIRRLGRLYETL